MFVGMRSMTTVARTAEHDVGHRRSVRGDDDLGRRHERSLLADRHPNGRDHVEPRVLDEREHVVFVHDRAARNTPSQVQPPRARGRRIGEEQLVQEINRPRRADLVERQHRGGTQDVASTNRHFARRYPFHAIHRHREQLERFEGHGQGRVRQQVPVGFEAEATAEESEARHALEEHVAVVQGTDPQRHRDAVELVEARGASGVGLVQDLDFGGRPQ
jgi:hypothetical protein